MSKIRTGTYDQNFAEARSANEARPMAQIFVETVQLVRNVEPYPVMAGGGASFGDIVNQTVERALEAGVELQDVNVQIPREVWQEMQKQFHHGRQAR